MKKTIIALMCMILNRRSHGAEDFHFWSKDWRGLHSFLGQRLFHGGQLNYLAGLFMEYRFSNKFSTAPEIVFAAQGGKNNGAVINPENMPPYGTAPYGSDYISADYIYNLNYINVPVMLKYNVTPALSIDFGPQLGINVYHK